MKSVHFLIGVMSLAIVLTIVAWEWNHLTSPGPLHPSHDAVAALQGSAGCAACHGQSGAPMSGACIACHQEIQQQMNAGRGLHASMPRNAVLACGECHREHTGASIALVSDQSFIASGIANPDTYDHKHVPGFELAGRHVEITCTSCHAQAHAPSLKDGQLRFLGLKQACASCHEDPHKDAFGNDCVSCHGQVHAFKDAPDFSHTSSFKLEGGHSGLGCEKCHEPSGPTSVGVLHGHATDITVRDCISCHKDPHEGSLGTDCSSCHGTSEPFDHAAEFEHTEAFPLVGGHAALACKDCHEKAGPRSVASLTTSPLPARTCVDCHPSPHQPSTLKNFATLIGSTEPESCVQCHDPKHESFLGQLAMMTPELHKATGFALAPPHDKALCVDCHAQFGQRAALAAGPDLQTRFAALFPGRTPDECVACHQDPHRGQFADGPTKGQCIACHANTHFAPSEFDATHHNQCRFTLTGAHEAVACVLCHKPDATGFVRFVPTPTECDQCHRDVHDGRFDKAGRPVMANRPAGCARCHSTASFAEIEWSAKDHGLWTGYELHGEHATATCVECHGRRSRPDARGRTLGQAPTTCNACHTDPHAGQFARNAINDCARCHTDAGTFKQTTFDHQRDSSFKLDETHAKVACTSCHRPVEISRGISVIRYRPLGNRCQDCHDPGIFGGKEQP